MDIQVTGRHMDITDIITNYARGKAADDLAPFPRVESVHIILNVEKYRHIAEVCVQASNHLRVEGKVESDDMYASIDGAVEKVVKQMRKAKDKVQSHKADGIAKTEVELKKPDSEG